MTYASSQALVEGNWLKKHLEDNSIKVIDATWYLPILEKDAKSNFLERHIPGAVFFDIDTIADQENPLPHMLPSAEQFAYQVGQLGISNDKRIIIYDSSGGFSAAARVWWMFRLFGHQNVALLNGGLIKWLSDGHAIEKGSTNYNSCQFFADFN